MDVILFFADSQVSNKVDSVHLPAEEIVRRLSAVPTSCSLHGRRFLEVSLWMILVQKEPVDSREVGPQAQAAAAGDPVEDQVPPRVVVVLNAMMFPSTR